MAVVLALPRVCSLRLPLCSASCATLLVVLDSYHLETLLYASGSYAASMH